MATRDDMIWAAGFFDGEGCVQYHRVPRPSQTYYYPKVTVTQKHRPVLDWLSARWGGPVSAIKPGGYPNFSWQLVSAGARIFLQDIQPFTRTKREQIDLVLGKSVLALTEEEIQLLKDLKRREPKWPDM